MSMQTPVGLSPGIDETRGLLAHCTAFLRSPAADESEARDREFATILQEAAALGEIPRLAEAFSATSLARLFRTGSAVLALWAEMRARPGASRQRYMVGELARRAAHVAARKGRSASRVAGSG